MIFDKVDRGRSPTAQLVWREATETYEQGFDYNYGQLAQLVRALHSH